MNKRKTYGLCRRGLAAAAAGVLAVSPVTAYAAVRPNINLEEPEAPAPDINKDLSPEFAYTEDKWAALRDNVMEYEELADLIHEYNPTVRSNRESYNDMKNKTLNDVYEEVMEDVEDLWDQAGDAEDDTTRASLNLSANSLQKQADDLYEDPEMEKITYDQTEAGLVAQAQNLMITYEQSAYTLENLEQSRDLLESQYQETVARQAVGSATQVDVLNAQKSLQDQEASIISAQKSADNVHRSLCLMLGWSADAQPQIQPVPQPDLARIDTLNPDQDLETAIKNNYDIRYNQKKIENLTSSSLIESTKAEIQSTENSVASSLKTQYNTILTSRDALNTAQAQLDLAQINANTAEVQLAAGSITQLDYQTAQNNLLSAQNTVATSRLQLLQAMETYDWIVNGLIVSN